MTTQILIIELIALFVIFREWEDYLLRRNKNRAFWPNSNQAYTAKYKYPFDYNTKHWYYFGLYRPKYRERYIFSSTLLVFTTDLEHFLQFVQFGILFIVGYLMGIHWYIFAGMTIGKIVKEFLNID
jgi:hypothetical protein